MAVGRAAACQESEGGHVYRQRLLAGPLIVIVVALSAVSCGSSDKPAVWPTGPAAPKLQALPADIAKVVIREVTVIGEMAAIAVRATVTKTATLAMISVTMVVASYS